MIRYLTAGETHGKCLVAVIEGLPSNIPVDISKINEALAERQKGYGRGDRMKIETDSAEILTGIRNGLTLGSPVTLKIENKDWINWEKVMSPENVKDQKSVIKPRPGHADLPGAMKYDHRDMRNILERASARETAARVAVGSVAEQMLESFGVKVFSHVVEIGGVKSRALLKQDENYIKCEFQQLLNNSPVRCVDTDAAKEMVDRIQKAKDEGDTVGGVFEVLITGVPVGLGSHVQWDRKLDSMLSAALMSIQAIKGVEVGIGFDCARKPGSQVHDEIFYNEARGYYRETNNAGGIEGGISNGENIIIRAAMKPIPTLYKPLRSVNIETREPFAASIERSDTCAVPAASIVGKAACSWVIASAFLEKFGGDSLQEIRRNYEGYMQQVKNF